MHDILLCELIRENIDKSLEDFGFVIGNVPPLKLIDGSSTSIDQFKCTGKVWTDAETGEKLYEFKTFRGHAILLRARS